MLDAPSDNIKLGADHLTLEGGGWVISSQQDFFFLATWWAGNFFPSQTVCKIFFFSPHFSAGFFFPQTSGVFTFAECGYIYIAVITVIVLI